MTFDVFIPIAVPGINTQYRRGLHGKVFKAKPHKLWAKQAALIIGARAGELGWRDEGSQYDIEITVFNSRLDADAPVKLIIDTVTQKLGFDDSRIRNVNIGKWTGGKDGVKVVLGPVALGLEV